ncbi:MAG: hypothetical protein DBX39_01450 [Bacillota bacterium]|nr:MAG: hypothetical protein DBX39_01450 [Bacillota bacterium]
MLKKMQSEAAAGSFKDRMSGDSLSEILAAPVLERSEAVTINGNKAGRTDFDQSAMPSAQAVA